MNSERLFKTVMMDLSSEQAKLEDKLEITANSDLDLETKSVLIRETLIRLAQIELSIAKFNSMLVPNNNNSNTETENGNN
jgi:hypothetical protein